MASGGGRPLFLCDGEHPQKLTPVQLQPANSLGELPQSLLQVRRRECLDVIPPLMVTTLRWAGEYARVHALSPAFA